MAFNQTEYFKDRHKFEERRQTLKTYGNYTHEVVISPGDVVLYFYAADDRTHYSSQWEVHLVLEQNALEELQPPPNSFKTLVPAPKPTKTEAKTGSTVSQVPSRPVYFGSAKKRIAHKKKLRSTHRSLKKQLAECKRELKACRKIKIIKESKKRRK